MPQLAKVQERIKKYATKLDSTFQSKVKHYDVRVAEYNKRTKNIIRSWEKNKNTMNYLL